MPEKAQSQSQQRFMGMVHAYQKGTLDSKGLDPGLRRKVQKAARTMPMPEAEAMASTKHTGLPEKVARYITEEELLAHLPEVRRLKAEGRWIDEYDPVSGRTVTHIEDANTEKVATDLATPLMSMLGAAFGGVTGATRGRDKIIRKSQVMPMTVGAQTAELLKSTITGAALGAGAGHISSKSLKTLARVRAKGAPARSLKNLSQDFTNKQKFVVDEIQSMGSEGPLKDYSKYLKEYNIKRSRSHIDPKGAAEALGTKKGMSYSRMVDDTIGDVETFVARRVKQNQGWKASRKFRKDFAKVRIGTDAGVSNIIRRRAKEVWGMDKLAAGRYQEQLYKSQVEKRTTGQRVTQGIKSSGIPSAIFTGGLVLGSGLLSKTPVPKALGRAGKAGAVMLAAGSVLGAATASSHRRTFQRTDKPTKGEYIRTKTR